MILLGGHINMSLAPASYCEPLIITEALPFSTRTTAKASVLNGLEVLMFSRLSKNASSPLL